MIYKLKKIINTDSNILDKLDIEINKLYKEIKKLDIDINKLKKKNNIEEKEIIHPYYTINNIIKELKEKIIKEYEENISIIGRIYNEIIFREYKIEYPYKITSNYIFYFDDHIEDIINIINNAIDEHIYDDKIEEYKIYLNIRKKINNKIEEYIKNNNL